LAQKSLNSALTPVHCWHGFNKQDSGLPNTKGAGLLLATQAERAQGYKNYTTRLAQLKPIIGMHWFQWSDQPAAGRSDGENSNFGLVNKDGT
jgi:agarase